jgi:maltose alpha-D-glucosyltransferase/alpha-amylase
MSVARPGTSQHVELLLTELEVTLARGVETYLLPLAIAWEDTFSDALPQQLALARVRRGRRVGYLTDAFAIDTLPLTVLRLLAAAAVRPLAAAVRPLVSGEIRFMPTAQLTRVEFRRHPEIRRLSAEQSNSLLIVDDRAVLKLIRRLSPGIHPEAEMTRYLTERGFANAAPLLGEVARFEPDGTPYTMALVQGFIRNQGDGWGWTLDFLSRVLNSAGIVNPDGQTEAIADAMEAYGNFAAVLGRRLAELHAVLAMPTDDPAFAPETATAADIAAWSGRARAQVEAALAALGGVASWPDAQAAQAAAGLADQRAALLDAIDALVTASPGTLKTRVHGDFHLRRVLVSSGDAYIIDFEGEPTRPLEERRAKTSPLRDVAGVLRCFDYAAAVASTRAEGPAQADASALATLLDRFTDNASEAFLAAYRAGHAASEHCWLSEASEPALLDLFLLEMAAYETCREAADRPGWVRVPLHGLARIAARTLCAAETVSA